MAHNTVGEWSDGEDGRVFEMDEGARANLEGDDDDLIRSINEDEVLNQVGRGKKRKSNDQNKEPQYDYYEIPPPKERKSKKFNMKAMEYSVRFNNDLNDVDLLETHERTHDIFHHLLEDVTKDMNSNDQVRFILRSNQLQTPIAIPFLPLEKLTTEKVLSHVEKVVQSNEEFRLNDTVTVDIVHVEMPQGSGKSRVKRNIVNIHDYLKKKRSIVTINNKDNYCLARALAVGIAKIEQDPRYVQIRDSSRHIQYRRALDLHQAANVPFDIPCGLNEVNLFQQYLTNYQIIVVSGAQNNSIIYPYEPPGTDEKPILGLYYHNNHFDTITSLPGFLNRSYFCRRCHKAYSNTADHVCPAECGSCRRLECFLQGDGILCNECNRMFKNQACYNHHKGPINGGGRSTCEVVRKCEKCGKAMDVRQIRNGHMCGKKCPTCEAMLEPEDTDHLCYIQQLKQAEEPSYNHLLFFDLEATQEHGIHHANLCVVYDEEKEVAIFRGQDTVKEFWQWLLTPEHKDCIVIAHNFQGYDSYLILKYLDENAIHYKVLYSGAKCISITISMFDIKFIDSLNFIPMKLAKFPKTFAQPELCKGYFPHLFNKDENQDYVGPLPCQDD